MTHPWKIEYFIKQLKKHILHLYMLRETLCRENLFEINFPVYVVKISGHFQKLLTCPFD